MTPLALISLANPAPKLIPGDVLLYGSDGGIVDKLICLKTWSRVCHIEIYAGDGMSVASRNGIGVNKYAFRARQLAFVLRPHSTPDMLRAMEWFWRTAKGEKYDFLGLMCFFLAVKRGSRDRMFCSEFANRFFRHARVRAFHPSFDSDQIAPGNFLMSAEFDWIWTAKSPA